MTSSNALRYLAHEAARCHALSMAGDKEARDAHTMLCLLLPSLLEALRLPAMEDYETRAFEFELKQTLRRVAEMKAMRRDLNGVAA